MPKRRPIRLEDLFELKAVGRVAMSPDGREIAFELKRHDAAENKNFVQIMAVPTAGGPMRPLTAAAKHSDALPKWSPDGRRLAFISTRDKAACLYVMSMSGGEPRRITDRDGQVHEFNWSPDGRRLVYTYQAMTEREKLERDGKNDEVRRKPQFKHITRLFHRLDGAGWWNGNYKHIYVVSAEGGKPRQLTSSDHDDLEPTFSPDGRLISFTSNRIENADLFTDNADIYVVRPSGGAVRRITTGTGARKAHAWSPDGRWIAYIGNSARVGEGWKFNERVWVVPARGGAAREVPREIDNTCYNLMLSDIASASFSPMPPLWSPDSGRLAFVVSEHGAVHLYERSLERRDSRCVVGGEINLMFVSQAQPGGPVALTIGTATNPGDVYVANPGQEWQLTRLTSVNAGLLDRIELSQPEPFAVNSGAATVQGWVLRPPAFDKRRKYPAILQIHGGPYAHYGHAFFHELQWLAAQGYVVCYSNPRGSTSYGLKYMNCIHGDWGNLDYQDVMRVADWLFARPYVDRRRVGVTGGSYGGFMTNWIVGHTHRFRAAVTQRSVVNMESMMGTSDFSYEFSYELEGTPWKNVEALRRQSPLTYVKNIRTPLLIEHEEEDYRCSIEQAEQLFAALKTLGRTVELVRFEGESHSLCRTGRPQNRAERLRRIAEWFRRHMG